MALSASFKIPGAFISIVFGAGSQSPLTAPRTVVIMDYGTTGPLDQAKPLASADEAAATFGPGSHIHLAAQAFFEEFTFGTLYACRYAEAGGGVAAAKKVECTLNALTGGSIFVDINGLEPIEVVVTAGDGTGAQLAAIVNAVNIRAQYPCTGSVTGGSVDIGGVSYVANQSGVRVAHTGAVAGDGPRPTTTVGVSVKDITVLLAWAGTATDIGTGNAGVKYTANQPGVRVAHVNPGMDTATESVSVVGRDISVTLRYALGAPTSTAAQVRTAVLASAAAMLLLTAVALTGDGTGTVVAAALTALPGANSSTCDQVRAAVAASTAAMLLLSSVANTTPPGAGLAGTAALTAITQAYATFTWKQKGGRSNQFKLRLTSAGVTGTSYTVTDTVTGITDGNPQTALDSLLNADYDFLVTGADTSDATTGLNKFITSANDRSGPFVGLRGVVIGASLGTYGQVTALSLSQNAHRLQIAWCRNADITTVELAAKMGAVRSQLEGSDPAQNFDYQQFSKFRGPYVSSDRISVVEANNALNNGVTPIGINRGGKAYIWRSITTRYQDSLGAPDYRTLDTSKVAVVDYIADFLAQDYLVKGFQQMKVRADSGDQRPQYQVLTPKMVKDWILGILYESQNREPVVLENVEANVPNLTVELSAVVPGRIVARVPLDVIEGAHQFDITLFQIG